MLLLTWYASLQRNKAQTCSFSVKGECKRGAECPYRHEIPAAGELAQQNIKDRYLGVNDPVAKKMMQRANNLSDLVPPTDTSITTLYIGMPPLSILWCASCNSIQVHNNSDLIQGILSLLHCFRWVDQHLQSLWANGPLSREDMFPFCSR